MIYINSFFFFFKYLSLSCFEFFFFFFFFIRNILDYFDLWYISSNLIYCIVILAYIVWDSFLLVVKIVNNLKNKFFFSNFDHFLVLNFFSIRNILDYFDLYVSWNSIYCIVMVILHILYETLFFLLLKLSIIWKTNSFFQILIKFWLSFFFLLEIS